MLWHALGGTTCCAGLIPIGPVLGRVEQARWPSITTMVAKGASGGDGGREPMLKRFHLMTVARRFPYLTPTGCRGTGVEHGGHPRRCHTPSRSWSASSAPGAAREVTVLEHAGHCCKAPALMSVRKLAVEPKSRMWVSTVGTLRKLRAAGLLTTRIWSVMHGATTG